MIANDLWQKAGGVPASLPASDHDADGLPWDNLVDNADGRTACGYTKAPDWPDFDPTTQHAVWISDGWSIQALPTPAPAIVRVSRYEFSQLLTIEEKVKISAARAQIRAMTPANYADNAYAGLVGLEQVLDAFDLPTDIELTAAATIYAVETVLVAAGIITSDRATHILANLPPA